VELVLHAALIGILQGLTEFIPVSSSAHLELAPWIAGWPEGGVISSLSFDVFLHLGTLVALLAYFGRDWLRLLGAAIASIRERRIGGTTSGLAIEEQVRKTWSPGTGGLASFLSTPARSA